MGLWKHFRDGPKLTSDKENMGRFGSILVLLLTGERNVTNATEERRYRIGGW